MKAAMNFFVYVLRHLAHSFIPMSVSVVLGFNISAAHALSLFTSYIYVGDETQTVYSGPAPGPLSSVVQTGGTDIYGYAWSTKGSATTTFGQGIISTGSVAVGTINAVSNASYLSSSESGAYSAVAGGYVQFDLTITPTSKLPPFQPPNIPITFSIAGNASLSGTGEYFGGDSTARLNTYSGGVAIQPARIWTTLPQESSGAPYGGAFAMSQTVDYTTGVTYLVEIGGDTEAVAFFDVQNATASIYVDPTISFDQYAFDQTYGAQAFSLTDYYQLDVSPNVPAAAVPEPTTLLLLGSGLIGLAGLWRRFKK